MSAFTPEDYQKLHQSLLANTAPEILDLSDRSIDDTYARNIFNALRFNHSVKQVNLSNNQLTNAGADYIYQYLTTSVHPIEEDIIAINLIGNPSITDKAILDKIKSAVNQHKEQIESSTSTTTHTLPPLATKKTTPTSVQTTQELPPPSTNQGPETTKPEESIEKTHPITQPEPNDQTTLPPESTAAATKAIRTSSRTQAPKIPASEQAATALPAPNNLQSTTPQPLSLFNHTNTSNNLDDITNNIKPASLQSLWIGLAVAGGLIIIVALVTGTCRLYKHLTRSSRELAFPVNQNHLKTPSPAEAGHADMANQRIYLQPVTHNPLYNDNPSTLPFQGTVYAVPFEDNNNEGGDYVQINQDYAGLDNYLMPGAQVDFYDSTGSGDEHGTQGNPFSNYEYSDQVWSRVRMLGAQTHYCSPIEDTPESRI